MRFLCLAFIPIFTSCSPLTEVPKFKEVKYETGYGLEQDGYMRENELIRKGYQKIDDLWISPERLRKAYEDMQFLEDN